MLLQHSIHRHLWLALFLLAADCARNTEVRADEVPNLIRYELKSAGNVSAAIYDAQGVQVRTLLNAEAQAAGKHQLRWDGLDAEGQPAPLGTYHWKLLGSQGLQAEYLMTLGTSTGLNHWPGQHGGPITVACDGESIVVGGAPEGSPLLASSSLDGVFQWNRPQFAAPEGAIDTAIDGDRVYSLQNSTSLYVVEKSTGKPVLNANQAALNYRLLLPIRKLDPIASSAQQQLKLAIPAASGPRYLLGMTVGQNEQSNTVIGCKIQDQWFGFYGLKPGESRTVLGPLIYENYHPVEPRDGKLDVEFTFQPSSPEAQWFASDLQLFAPVERIDARDGALVALFPAADTLAWVEPDTGTLLEQVKIADARDVTLIDAQTALVISGETVVRVSRAGTTKTVITGLSGPTRLAWDAAGKTLWVVEAGQSQQIKRFGKDFQLQATLGRHGGRQMGLYQPQDFLAVADVAADGHGGFVICETDSAPRRTARFDRDGKLLREWYGGQQFYTFASADPADPTLVWMDSQWGHLMQVKVDYEKRDWSVRACYRWDKELHPMLFTGFKMARHMIAFRADLKGAGQRETLLWSDAHSGLILKVDENAGLLRPVAGLGAVIQGGSMWNAVDADEKSLPRSWIKALSDIGKDVNKNPEVRKLYRGFGWADLNGSYDDQQGAMVLLPSDGHGFAGGSPCLSLWADLTIYQSGWGGKEGKPTWTAYPSQGRTPSGAPIWNWSKSVAGPVPPGNSAALNLVSLLSDPSGTYAIQHGGGDGYFSGGVYGGAHGAQWPANQIDASAVSKWDKDGRQLWRVGSHASRFEHGRGQMHYPTFIAGNVNGAIGVCDKIVSPCEFWSEDGLYIGGLLDQRADDGLPNRAYAWWRADVSKGDVFDNLAAFQYDMALGGSLAKLPNGDVVFFGSGWNYVPVYRVTGWDKIRRQEGTIKLSSLAPHATGDGQGVAAEFFATPDLVGEPALRQSAPRLWSEPARKGFEWPALEGNPAARSARWTGTVEPRFSEAYTFSVYAKGNVRFWFGGKLLVEVTNKSNEFNKVYTEPLVLTAGEHYEIKAEWTGAADGEFHLNWESPSQPIEHVPTTALHAKPLSVLPIVSIRGSKRSVLRPTSKSADSAEWIVSRQGPTDMPLTVPLKWHGTALAKRDYQPLPSAVTILAGKTEARLAVRLLAVKGIAATRELLVVPAITKNYLLDGTRGVAKLAIRDPSAKRLEVAAVTASGEAFGMVNAILNLNEPTLGKLTDGSGLDRSSEPPQHDTNVENAWHGDFTNPDRTVLTFDLGSVCDLSDLHIWNFNTRNAHGTGWGQGPSVRTAAHQVRLATSESAEGPWTDLGQFPLREPPGDRPDAGDLLPLGQRARYVQIHFSMPHEVAMVGLAEVEFVGIRPPARKAP